MCKPPWTEVDTYSAHISFIVHILKLIIMFTINISKSRSFSCHFPKTEASSAPCRILCKKTKFCRGHDLQPFCGRSKLTSSSPFCHQPQWLWIGAGFISLCVSQVIPGLLNVHWGSAFWAGRVASLQRATGFMPKHVPKPSVQPVLLLPSKNVPKVSTKFKNWQHKKNMIITKTPLVHSAVSVIVGNLIHRLYTFCSPGHHLW